MNMLELFKVPADVIQLFHSSFLGNLLLPQLFALSRAAAKLINSFSLLLINASRENAFCTGVGSESNQVKTI